MPPPWCRPRSTSSWGLVPNPFPLPILVSPSPLWLLPPVLLPMPPFTSPYSNLIPNAPTAAVGHVSPAAASPPCRVPESFVSQWIARPYYFSRGTMSWPSQPRLLESTHQGGVDPLSVPPPAGLSSCQTTCYPALEGIQGRLQYSN